MAKNTKRSAIGENLVLLRKERGYKQEQVADMLGIKRDTYARYETETNPPISIIKKICEFYNVSSDRLLGIDTVDDYTSMMRPNTPNRLKTYIAYNQDTNDSVILSDDEVNLIERFRKLSQEKQDALLIFIGD